MALSKSEQGPQHNDQHNEHGDAGSGAERRLGRRGMSTVRGAGLTVITLFGGIVIFTPEYPTRDTSSTGVSSRGDQAPAANTVDQAGTPAAACAEELIVDGRTYRPFDTSEMDDALMTPGRAIGTAKRPGCNDAGSTTSDDKTVPVSRVRGARTREAVLALGPLWVSTPTTDGATDGATGSEKERQASPTASASLPPAGACATEVMFQGRTYSQEGGTDANVIKGRLLGTGVIPACDDTSTAGSGITAASDEATKVRVFGVRGTSSREAVWVSGYRGFAFAVVR